MQGAEHISCVRRTDMCTMQRMTSPSLTQPPWDIDNDRPDVAILIALPEEFRTLAKGVVTGQHARASTVHTGYDYFFVGPRGYRCIATIMNGMGPTRAVTFTERLLDWEPALVVNIGIAGSLKGGDLRIGDVLVPSEVEAYSETGKFQGETGKIEDLWERRGKSYHPSPWIVDKVPHLDFAHQDACARWAKEGRADLRALWKQPLMKQLIEKGVLREAPISSNKHLASGDFVVASKEFAKWIRKANGDIHAAEMEAAGMMVATECRAKPVDALVIRGISDHVDVPKAELDAIGNGALRGLAMRNAWRFLQMLMELGLLHDPSMRSTTQSRNSTETRSAMQSRNSTKTVYLNDKERTTLWQRTRWPNELRFDGATFVFTPGKQEFTLGSKSDRNDFILKGKGVSQYSLCIRIREGRTFVERLHSCKNAVLVHGSAIEKGKEREILHGQSLIVGECEGRFVDGRYAFVSIDDGTIDRRTSLLGRFGLATQMAYEQEQMRTATMLIVRSKGSQPQSEDDACAVALAWHAADPTIPVGRVGKHAIALLPSTEIMTSLLNVAQQCVKAGVVAGHLALRYEGQEAIDALEQSLSAMERVLQLNESAALCEITAKDLEDGESPKPPHGGAS